MKAVCLVALFVTISAWALAQGVVHSRPPLVNLSQTAKRKLVEKAVSLKAGDEFLAVTNLLGNPDVDITFTGQNGVRVSRFLEYDATVWERKNAGFASGADAEFVKISLDRSGKVSEVFVKLTFQ